MNSARDLFALDETCAGKRNCFPKRVPKPATIEIEAEPLSDLTDILKRLEESVSALGTRTQNLEDKLVGDMPGTGKPDRSPRIDGIHSTSGIDSSIPAALTGLESKLSQLEGLPDYLRQATVDLIQQSTKSQEYMETLVQRIESSVIERLERQHESFAEVSTAITSLRDLGRASDSGTRSSPQKSERDVEEFNTKLKVQAGLLQPGHSTAGHSTTGHHKAEAHKLDEYLIEQGVGAQFKEKSSVQIYDQIEKVAQADSHSKKTAAETLSFWMEKLKNRTFLQKRLEPPRGTLYQFVLSDAFNAASSALIVANTVVLGVQTDILITNAIASPESDEPAWFSPVNITFTVCFLLELLIRLIAEKLYFFIGRHFIWNMFDLAMVVLALLSELATLRMGNATFVRVVKIIRMFRAVRILRVFRFFRELRLMICSVMGSFVSLGWAFLLIFIMVYCVATLLCQSVASFFQDKGVDGISKTLSHDLDHYYGNIPRAMYSLILAVSGGLDWHMLVDPLSHVSPGLVVVAIAYVIFVVFGMLNVLTGVFVDRAAEFSHMDHDIVIESERRKVESLCVALKKLFKEIDVEGHGNVAWEEFNVHCQREDVKAYMGHLELNVEDTLELFRMLDDNANGMVNIDEFINGCLRLKGEAKSLDMLHLQASVNRVKEMLVLIGEQMIVATRSV